MHYSKVRKINCVLESISHYHGSPWDCLTINYNWQCQINAGVDKKGSKNNLIIFPQTVMMVLLK